jgi:hypothetical protein
LLDSVRKEDIDGVHTKRKEADATREAPAFVTALMFKPATFPTCGRDALFSCALLDSVRKEDIDGVHTKRKEADATMEAPAFVTALMFKPATFPTCGRDALFSCALLDELGDTEFAFPVFDLFFALQGIGFG